jgi:cytochrome P450
VEVVVTVSSTLPTLPFDQPHPLETAPLLRVLQAEGPVHRVRTAVGDPAWLVTGYAEVRQLLGDDRLGMSHPDPDRAARVNDSALFGGRPQGNHDTEHADRARFRGLLQPFFTAKRMRALRPRVDALVAELLDQLATQAPPVDLQQALAVPLPILVICELLGVPYEDRARFRAFSQAAAAVDDQERSQTGLMELWAYTRQLVAGKRARPGGDDVISGLCAVDGLDDDYIAMLAAMILFAGHETTVVQLGYGAVLLLTNPDHRDAVLADPALLPAAVEECLRAGNTGGGGIPRYPRTDIEVAGVKIPAGDLILLDNGAANHDASVFDDPHRFDPTRPANPHLSFGHGGHYCIGAPLARVELEAVFAQLIRRFPTMRLAVPVEALRVRRDLLTGGLAELPVTW